MRHASQPTPAPESVAPIPAGDNTDSLPQLYQLARKNLPPAESAGDKTEDAAAEGAVRLSVRRARSRFFELPPEQVGAGAKSTDGIGAGTDSEPSPPGTLKPPPPHTVAALSGQVTDFRPLEINSDFLPTATPPVAGADGAASLPTEPTAPAEDAEQTALLNPADPVNLRGLLDSADLPLTEAQKDRAERDLRAELTGLGILEPLLDTPGLTDIFVNGTEVWIEAGGTLRRAATRFETPEEARALALRLIGAAGGRLDDSHPIADAQTASGLRLHAVLPPLSRSGTLLSIRVRATGRPDLTDLSARGMFTEETGQVLRHLVRTRANFLVSGGTGTGKTTLLAALLGTCGSEERLVLVEDTAELFPVHPHTVSLQAREANTEGRGEVSLTHLIRAALRMRPTRLIVGECRGAEVVDMLSAMNTGHAGTGGTLHANSTAAVPARLYAMGALAGLKERAVALQAATALDYIVHIERIGGVRKVAEIARLTLVAGELAVSPVCRVERGRRGDYLHWLPAGAELREAVEAECAKGTETLDAAGAADGGAGETP